MKDLMSKIEDSLTSLGDSFKGAIAPTLGGVALLTGYLLLNAYINRETNPAPRAPTSIERSCDLSDLSRPFMSVFDGDEYNEDPIHIQMDITDRINCILNNDPNMPNFNMYKLKKQPKYNSNSSDSEPEQKQPKTKKSFNLEAMKIALGMVETENRINSRNRRTGASGTYQYLPSTALGLIKQAKREGLKAPYSGRMIKSDISYSLRTSKKLNQWLADYDLSKRAELFDGNPELIAASHYMSPERLMKIINRRFPNIKDLSNIDIMDLTRDKVQGGLLINRPDGEQPVPSYAKCASNLYWDAIERSFAKNN